ncbi:MAG: thioesterase family protein [Parvibaculaceae bacterium]
MAYPAPFVSALHRIDDQWIDYNGHFNMAYYHVIFDRAVDEAFDSLGLGAAYVKQANASYFTLETHATYLRELHAGDEVRVALQMLDFDRKRIHYVQQMMHRDGWLACVSEYMVMHVDLAAKRSAPFPPDIIARIEAMHAAHKVLPVPPQVGHRIAIPRKA